jgi:hypothetical protein
MNQRRIFGVLASVLTLAGCGTSAESPSGSDECTRRASRAAGQVMDVVEANRTCKVDSDCVLVPVAGRCFDACEEPMSTAGVPAMKAAIDSVERTECAAFLAHGCKLIIPPCIPEPPSRVCRDEQCQ